MTTRPLCFVLMPFGRKPDSAGGPDIDFDEVYRDGIRPAVEEAGLEPIRADEERIGGIIHKPMFERLLLCDFAVADLTGANANVYYELGIRHAVRPATTLPIFAARQRLPFDVSFLRALPYELDEGNQLGTEGAQALRAALVDRLVALREAARQGPAVDSPLFQLLAEYRAPDIARLKTDVFRNQVQYSEQVKRRLARAREQGSLTELKEVETGLGPFDALETGVLVDLFLSYRALEAWEEMIELYDRLPPVLRGTVMLREQRALALNRSGRRSEAIEVLVEVLAEQGPSSETLGLLGRVHKDLWKEACRAGRRIEAGGHLDRAIDAYDRGFAADWRDAYPGVNAATLLEVRGDAASLDRKGKLLPVVRFAAEQRLRGRAPDYWDHATLLEVAALAGDQTAAERHLGDALACRPEGWMRRSTADNLELIEEARSARGPAEPWLREVIGELRRP